MVCIMYLLQYFEHTPLPSNIFIRGVKMIVNIMVKNYIQDF